MIIAEMQRGMNIEKCACLFFSFQKRAIGSDEKEGMTWKNWKER